jgi:hypothetical protein
MILFYGVGLGVLGIWVLQRSGIDIPNPKWYAR